MKLKTIPPGWHRTNCHASVPRGDVVFSGVSKMSQPNNDPDRLRVFNGWWYWRA